MCKSKRGIKREDGGKVRAHSSVHYITTLCVEIDCFMSTGRVQVTAPADREEKERPNQRMYRPAERPITRTSEAIGETATRLKVLR